MVRVPVSEMFHIGKFLLNCSENSFLILAVLEETRRAPVCVLPWPNHAEHVDLILFTMLAIAADNPSACLIGGISVAFIEDCFEGFFRDRYSDIRGLRSKHWQRSSPSKWRNPLAHPT